MQIQRIIQGKMVICEACGFEFSARIDDIKDLIPAHGMEPQNLLRPEDLGTFGDRDKIHPTRKPPVTSTKPLSSKPLVTVKDTHPRINKDNILRALSFNWITLQDLAQKISVLGRREFYVLRMKLNELNRLGYIQMDFQVNRVLIRKLRQSKRVS
ncbi:MAG: hypothetical protein JW776_03810 [Candidatus Lokiarchaeota archaeon]|nr:hypothetical protein [Candidatus Lokiarchaeota archaeon]